MKSLEPMQIMGVHQLEAVYNYYALFLPLQGGRNYIDINHSMGSCEQFDTFQRPRHQKLARSSLQLVRNTSLDFLVDMKYDRYHVVTSIS